AAGVEAGTVVDLVEGLLPNDLLLQGARGTDETDGRQRQALEQTGLAVVNGPTPPTKESAGRIVEIEQRAQDARFHLPALQEYGGLAADGAQFLSDPAVDGRRTDGVGAGPAETRVL